MDLRTQEAAEVNITVIDRDYRRNMPAKEVSNAQQAFNLADLYSQTNYHVSAEVLDSKGKPVGTIYIEDGPSYLNKKTEIKIKGVSVEALPVPKEDLGNVLVIE